MRDYLSDLAAERAVLASVFAHGANAYDDVCDIVTTNTFTLESNQIIWACMEHVLKEDPNAKLDLPSIMSAAHSLGVKSLIDTDNEAKHLRAVMNMPILPATGRRMAAKIRKLEIAYLLESQLEEARRRVRMTNGDESIDKIVAAAEEPIFDFTSLLTETGNTTVKMGQNVSAYMEHLANNPRDMVGIPTGLHLFDMAIGGGIRPNSLDIIAARPKTGKTQLVDNVGLFVAKNQGLPAYNIDTEMTLEEHQHRIIANLADVPVRDIETGKFGLKDLSRAKVREASALLETLPYYYDCIIGKQFEEVMAGMRRWVTRTVGLKEDGKANPCIIIYDYLKMLDASFSGSQMQEYQALGFVTTALKNFMGRYGVGCLCFAQLNRDGIDREDTGVISGSDRIIHYATSFTIYKLKSSEERAEAGPGAMKYTHKLVPIISRHGGEGIQDGDYINIQAVYGKARITEGPLASQVADNSANAVGKTAEGFVVQDWEDDSGVPEQKLF